MRTLVAALALILPTTASLPVTEDDRSGDSYWVERCASEDDTHRAACHHYLDGLTDGLVLGMGLGRFGGKTQVYCLPEGVTLGQMREAVVNFLDQHPRQTHRPFSIIATHALRKSFPCPN
jgi:hypothetical protein